VLLIVDVIVAVRVPLPATPVTVTNCGEFQFRAVNVKDDGDTVAVLVLLLVKLIVTFPSG
jgi:hypothetical protein